MLKTFVSGMVVAAVLASALTTRAAGADEAKVEGRVHPELRMYWPIKKAPSILDGTWTPPKVEKAS